MKQRNWRVTVALRTRASLALAAACVVLVSVATSAEARPSAVTAPFLDNAGCGSCDVCTVNRMQGHETWTNLTGWRSIGTAHDCNIVEPDCSSHGNECGEPQLVGYSELWAAAANADASELRILLERYPNQLRYNTDRKAIQFYGCRNALIAHLPLSVNQAKELAE